MMRNTERTLERFARSEAGMTLATHGFTATPVGGIVVFEGRRCGVRCTVIAADTLFAPRFTTDPVRVSFGEDDGSAEDGWELTFQTLESFIKTLM